MARSTTRIHPAQKHKAKAKPPKHPQPAKPPDHTPPAAPPPLPAFRVGQLANTPHRGNGIGATLSERLDAAPLAMDRKSFIRMKRGKHAVDARIDLHGMTLAAAHPRLIGFIHDSHARGCRLVLVITGKGKRKRDDGPIPQRTGVLKHQVPLWLRSGALAPVVLQVTEAHQKHGGGGAYYVYLRRAR